MRPPAARAPGTPAEPRGDAVNGGAVIKNGGGKAKDQSAQLQCDRSSKSINSVRHLWPPDLPIWAPNPRRKAATRAREPSTTVSPGRAGTLMELGDETSDKRSAASPPLVRQQDLFRSEHLSPIRVKCVGNTPPPPPPPCWPLSCNVWPFIACYLRSSGVIASLLTASWL